MSKSQLKIGSLLSYLQILLNIVIQLIYTPLMIRLLGKSEYGLYNTVTSTISMLSILSLGFNSGYIRYYSIYKKNDAKNEISKLNGLFMIIFLIIGFVGLICGLFLSFNLDLVFDNGLTSAEYTKARILMLIMTVDLATTFPMSVFWSIVSAHERFILLKILGIVRTTCSPLIILPLLLMGFKSVAVVTVTVLVDLFVNFVYLMYVLFKMKEKFIFHDFEKGIFKQLFSYTVFIAINIIIDQINWNIDKLLLGRYIGTSEVAVYSVGYTIFFCYMYFSGAISSLFTPRIHRIVNDTKDNKENQRAELTELFVKVGRIQFLVLALIASGVIFFGRFFINVIWAGEGYDDSYYVALLLMLPASIDLIQNLGIEIQRAKNKHRFSAIVYTIMAFINFGLSIFLCKKYGAVGSAFGTALAFILANGIVMNIYYARCCDIDIPYFWKNILSQSAGLIIPVCSGIFIVNFIEIKSVLMYAILVIIYTLVYSLSMWFFGMNEYEKNLVRKTLKKTAHKSA